MTTLATLQSELAEAILAYCKYAERMAHQDDFTRVYSTQQILELDTLINDSTRIARLHQAMKQYLENQLPRPFGERMRYTFDMQREYDLHNNLARVLIQPKYHPDKLEMIDERAQWKEEHETSLQNLREELLNHPEVVSNAEIIRLNKVNAELQAIIKSLRKELQTAQQERDYWRVEHANLTKVCQKLELQKTHYKTSYEICNSELKKLKEDFQQKHSTGQTAKPDPSKSKTFR